MKALFLALLLAVAAGCTTPEALPEAPAPAPQTPGQPAVLLNVTQPLDGDWAGGWNVTAPPGYGAFRLRASLEAATPPVLGESGWDAYALEYSGHCLDGTCVDMRSGSDCTADPAAMLGCRLETRTSFQVMVAEFPELPEQVFFDLEVQGAKGLTFTLVVEAAS